MILRRIQSGIVSLVFLVGVCSSPARSVSLRWTAVGDDGNVGTAHHYVLKGSTDQAALEADFWGCAAEICVEIPGLPVPQPAGSDESYDIPSGTFPPGAVVYFRIVAVDESGNIGPPSNTASKIIPDSIAPAAIIDLR